MNACIRIVLLAYISYIQCSSTKRHAKDDNEECGDMIGLPLGSDRKRFLADGFPTRIEFEPLPKPEPLPIMKNRGEQAGSFPPQCICNIIIVIISYLYN